MMRTAAWILVISILLIGAAPTPAAPEPMLRRRPYQIVPGAGTTMYVLDTVTENTWEMASLSGGANMWMAMPRFNSLKELNVPTREIARVSRIKRGRASLAKLPGESSRKTSIHLWRGGPRERGL